ncbi:hypothetical protein [Pseudomonas sp. MWU15-20650]|uniref:hypothetical protein n=1 Tax=Pseudomonas sp. MWU15-20650 TaxID=2933107 RepID=UPI00200E8EA7|nr:hypothetical protein [Pseudomonas sp. MWU15-20650]
MSWEKVGKFLVALLACMASITAIYVAFKDDTKLEADLSYHYQSTPSQFSERLAKAGETLKYGTVYDSIKRVAGDALSHEQIDKMVDLVQAPYLSIFDKPFQKGPDNYPVRLFIHLQNTGSKVVKDVHIKLPAKGLVQIRDDSHNETVKPELTSSVEIPSIVQNGVYKLWIYFEGDLEALKAQGVHIGSSDGVAQVRVYEEVIGFKAHVAENTGVLMAMLVALLVAVLMALYLVVTTHETADGTAQNA